MNFRTLIFLSAITCSVASAAEPLVLLKNGAIVPKATAEKVYTIIKTLFNDGKINILGNLVRTSAQDLEVKLNTTVFGTVKKESDTLAEICSLGLCDSTGNMTQDIFDVIQSSITMKFKGLIPLHCTIRSPISLKNYLPWVAYKMAKGIK